MNAEQVARILGISGKTVLRHIAKGTIMATRKHAQELSIEEDQVEILRQALILEKSRRMPGISQDTSGRMTELEQRVAELEEKVRVLESGQMSLHMSPISNSAVDLHAVPYDYLIEEPREKPQKRAADIATIIPADLPPGTLSSSDFAAQLTIKYDDFKRYMTRGVNGEKLDITEIPHHTRVGYFNKYFTPSQQEQAIAILGKHRKLPS